MHDMYIGVPTIIMLKFMCCQSDLRLALYGLLEVFFFDGIFDFHAANMVNGGMSISFQNCVLKILCRSRSKIKLRDSQKSSRYDSQIKEDVLNLCKTNDLIYEELDTLWLWLFVAFVSSADNTCNWGRKASRSSQKETGVGVYEDYEVNW